MLGWRSAPFVSITVGSTMTWNQLLSRLLELGKTRDEIAQVLRDAVKAGQLSAAESESKLGRGAKLEVGRGIWHANRSG